MTNEAQKAQAEVIEEFGFFDDWMDRYQYLIDMGRKRHAAGFRIGPAARAAPEPDAQYRPGIHAPGDPEFRR